jgi:hypothetical protein
MIEIDEKKQVSIDESGILTIHSDNATWVQGDVTTEIKGDYVINSESLHRLMVMMTKNPMLLCYVRTNWYYQDYYPSVHSTLITTDKEIAEELEKMHKAYEKAKKELEVVKRERDWEKTKNENLTRKIEEYNQSRHCWERKIIINTKNHNDED